MAGQWVDAASSAEIRGDEPLGVVAGNRDIALYRVEDRIFASSNVCTHGQARLCDGFLEGYEIECPLHQGRFDIRTGKALCAPLTVDVRVYEVRVEAGRVLVDISD